MWKDVVGYEGLYKISDQGELYSIKHDRMSKYYTNSDGYYITNLKSKNFSVHRIVALTFIPNPENKKEVNHKNGIKKDNRVKNLEWCTRLENERHAWRIGLKKCGMHKPFVWKRGEDRKRTKFSFFTLYNAFIMNVDKIKINEEATSPSQLDGLEPAPAVGFSFLNNYRNLSETKKHIIYKPAKVNTTCKRWFVWYSYLNPETGKYKRFKVYEDINRIKNLEEKIEYADTLRKAVDYNLKGGYNPFAKNLKVVARSWSLMQGLNYFKQKLYDRGLRKRSIQSYESVIRSMYKGLKPVLLDDIKSINKNHIQQFLSGNNWSNTTYNNHLTFIRTIFNFLIEAEILETNPAKRVKPLPENITKHRFFDERTWERIKKESSPELMKFILFLYHTGTRPNEARQLKHEHILRDRKLLLVPAGISKNKKDDYVPLSESFLNNFPKGEGLIFGSAINYYSGKFQELKKKLKLEKDFTLYSIKATRAVHLAQDGASPYSIMSLFRHSSLEITMSYLRGLGLNVNREAADKVREM